RPLLRAAKPTDDRGTAAGADRYRDGRWLRGNKTVLSGIAGYWDKPCRATAYTAKDVVGWFRVLPYIHAVDDVFKRERPARYNAQMAAVRRTPPGYVIPATAFTTITVNRNWRTHVHKDRGDLKEGFGVMSVIEAGVYGGCYLCFPKWRVAVDMRSQDVLL